MHFDNCYYWLLGLCFWGGVSASAQNGKPFVVPEIKEWKGGYGYFKPASSAVICWEGADEKLRLVAECFATDYRTMFGKNIKVSSRKPAKADFWLKLTDETSLGGEGYRISVGKQVVLTAATPKGIYWGTRTLLQMAEQHPKQQLPKGEIKDMPDYTLRGLMLDCGRKYIPMDYLNDLVKVMAYYKMNALQLHLNDNGFKQFFGHEWDKTYAAFRLECDTYPGLTARDGAYTKKEFREFQMKAATQYVDIIPEIDAPAHTLAFTHYRPEIGSREYGMDHLDLFNPETYRFMDGLFKEYLSGENPVFRGPRVHIGTDEYSNKDQEVVEKFREFTDHYIRLVESYGKQACVWGALTHAKGETPVKSENVLMSAWYNGYADPKEMVRQGYHLISIPDGLLYIVPAAGYYADYLNIEHLYKNWTPAQVGNAVFEEKDPAILGGMFAVWNDHVGNGISVKDIHHRLYPALQTLSTKMWTGKSVSLAYADFEEQRLLLSEAPGVNQLGRVGHQLGVVYRAAEVKPCMQLPLAEIGYDYIISFDLEVAVEERGTVLFQSPNAIFYLSDPVDGTMGFTRDGYHYSLGFRPSPGEKVHVEIIGTSTATTLKVNGKVIADLQPQTLYDYDGKDKMTLMSTLVFPLQRAGNFKSKIRHLEIHKIN